MAKNEIRRDLGGDGRVAQSQTTLRGDLYHYLLTASWPVLIGLVALCFVLGNLLFAAGYYFGGGIDNARPGSFADTFFFSVQTMATIGYGRMTPVSMLANVLVSGEAFFGLLGLAMVTGLIFAKFSRPTARIRFTKFALIAPHEGVPSLSFRMANLRGNRIVEAQVHVGIARQETTREGVRMRRLYDLPLLRDRNPLFALSWTAIHPIAEGSPLFGATRETLEQSAAMIVVSLLGLDETFSQTINARHLYGPGDIVWGGRFADILSGGGPARGRAIDYSRFDELLPQ
ncbi:MAG: ion channel [Candidatus Binataceae bacterium]